MVQGSSRQGDEAFCSPLSEVILHLRHVQSAVVVAVAALRRQNCEHDEDIASVLQRSVSDRLEEQIEKLEAASERRSRKRPVPRETRQAESRLIPL